MTVLGILGAGGCGRGILPLVRDDMEADDNAVFVDDALAGSRINRAEVLSLDQFAQLKDRAICLAVAAPHIRQQLDRECRKLTIPFFAARSVHHLTMDDVLLGEGALLSPFTTVTSNVRIGRHFHLNLYSYVEHDCVIGDFVTFAPAVRCNGNVTIGDGAYVGSGAVIRQGLSIGAGAVIGMGAVVTRDVPAGQTWVGNPARQLGA